MKPAGAVVVSGATGLVGGRLVPALLGRGVRASVLTRNPERAFRRFGADAKPLAWNGRDVAPDVLAGAGALVHLAGEPLFGGAPTRARRERIRASRIESTRALVETLGRLPPDQRPATFVCASAVGFYGSRGEERLDESAAPGRGFLAELCVAWEEAALAASTHGVRVVPLRIGIVLAREGGALRGLTQVFRLGLGGRIGSGRQWVPWIHLDDLVRLIGWIISDGSREGPLNAVAPNPVRNLELARTLASVLQRPARLPVPAWAIRLALGELAPELLDSRRVVPQRALEGGFQFAYPTLESALEAELGAGRDDT